jgi:hypothetical protein
VVWLLLDGHYGLKLLTELVLLLMNKIKVIMYGML